jgi:O-antigen/teichoic acid export membrane protein
VILRLDQIVMSHLSTDYQLGLYAVAVPLAEAALMASAAAQLVLLPRFLRSGRPEEMLRAIPLFAAAAALLCALVWPLSSWIVVFLFGAAFVDAAWPFSILLVGTFCAVWLDLLQSALGASGKPMRWAVSTAVGCVVMTGVLMVLIQPLGAVGAAIATTTGYATAAVLGSVMLWKQGRRRKRSLIMAGGGSSE